MGNCLNGYSYYSIENGMNEHIFETRWTCWKKIICCCGVAICIVIAFVVFSLVYGIIQSMSGIEKAK